MRFIAVLFLLIVLNSNCSTNKDVRADSTLTTSKSAQEVVSDKEVNNSVESKLSSKEKTEEENNKSQSIKNTIGLITLSEKYPSSNAKKDKNDFIKFYNEDGSLWYEFTFYYDGSDGKFEYQNDDFIAFAFHPDYSLLSLRCVGEDENRYKVIVNEETGLEKYVKKTDKNLELESWSEHLLKTFSVDLKKYKNTVFETPDGKEIKIDAEQIERFEAVEVKSDWLKIKWKIPNKNEEFKSGWIRWKKNDILLIDWFYLA